MAKFLGVVEEEASKACQPFIPFHVIIVALHDHQSVAKSQKKRRLFVLHFVFCHFFITVFLISRRFLSREFFTQTHPTY